MPTYSVRIVEQDGTVVRTLVGANIERVRFGMNGDVGEAVFTYPRTDPSGASGQAADVLLLDREAEIRRDSTTIFRGPMVRREARSGTGDMVVTVPGVGWYFSRRFIDAPLTNLLSNGDFESGTTGWTATSCTQTSVTSPVRRGTKSLQLVGTTTFAEQYTQQSVSVTGTGVGTALTVAAHFYIDSWTGPAVYSRGLYVESRNGGTVETYNEHEGAIDDDTADALDVWQRAEATIWVPPNATRTIYVRLYAPNGTIVWDSVELVEPLSLAIAPGAGEDIATTANRIVQFAQDATKSKSDLDIGTAAAPTTGVTFKFPKAWQYTDHTPVDSALNNEIVPLGVDWDIVAATKTFTVYHPRKGTDRSATVTLSLTTNVASYSLEEDGAQTETDVTVLGEGDGPDREEGRSVDTTDTGGLVLQGIHSSPPGTTVDKLDGLASEITDRTARLVRVLSCVVYGSLVTTLEIGDIVDVDITDGSVALSGDWRIVSCELTPRPHTLSLVLNEEV